MTVPLVRLEVVGCLEAILCRVEVTCTAAVTVFCSWHVLLYICTGSERALPRVVVLGLMVPG